MIVKLFRRAFLVGGMLLVSMLLIGQTTNNSPTKPAHASELLLDTTEVETASQILTTDWGFTVTYPGNWSVAPRRYSNMVELINVSSDNEGKVTPTVRVGITSDRHESHDTAVREIRGLSSGLKAPDTAFISVAGWPAFQHTWTEKREQPDHGPRDPDLFVIRVSTAIAAGNRLIRIEAWLASDSPEQLVEEVKTIGRSVVVDGSDAPGDGSPEPASGIDQFNGTNVETAAAGSVEDVPGSSGTTTSKVLTTVALSGASESIDLQPGFEQQIFPNRNGEVEIATSPDGRFIVIGRQAWWSYSQDGGQNFTNGGRIPFSNGDPSLAYGLSGNFYYAGIDENDGGGFPAPAPGTGSGVCPGPDMTSPFGYSCTNIAVSTDNGVTFPTALIVTAVVCPQRDDLDGAGGSAPAAGACFPDQEHIAADRFNAGSGGDQVYSTWRNFPGGVASLVCSQDSGQTWTAPLVVEADGKFPRITVGQDGFVYVAYYASGNYRIAKYSSCANGLTLQFRRTVFARNEIVCPFVGHDRCDQNPSSQMVAVDDTNPNHIYYAYAETAGSADNDRIIVQDSLDGGDTWTATRRRRVNANIPGKRIMPWICTTGGEAFVTWYDRRNAPVNANDRTDFYGGSAFLDHNGDLFAGPDFRINEAADDWCASGWPCSTREVASAEQCPATSQPQLAGICRADCDNPAMTDSAVPCDFSDGCAGLPGANAGEVCCTGNGCPKYGDYNGNACVAGRLLAAWASATPAPYIPPPGGSPPPIGILYSEILVGTVPQIQVPNAVTIDPVCGNDVGRGELEVCNTGNDILEVFSVTSSNPVFTITTPAGEGYPVRVSPDFCFPFEVVFSPTATGVQNTNLTISTNDPSNPSVVVIATGSLEVPVATTSGELDFGELCIGESETQAVQVCDTGKCNLTVTDASLTGTDCDDLTLVSPLPSDLPLTISPDFCFGFVVKFEPDDFTPPTDCSLSITTDDPDNPTITVPITASVGEANIVIDPASLDGLYAFPATVVEPGDLGCYSERPLVIRNNGTCPLVITDINATLPFYVTAPTEYPVTIPPGEETLDVTVRFDPLSGGGSITAPDQTTGTLTVISNDPDGDETAAMCGEAVTQSGVRVLIVDFADTQIDEVDMLHLQSFGIHTPQPVNIRMRNAPVMSTMVCSNTVQYHMNREDLPPTDTTGTDPNASYKIRAKEGRKQTKQDFALGQCDFKEFILRLR